VVVVLVEVLVDVLEVDVVVPDSASELADTVARPASSPAAN
jgi:hypothetical protein